MQVGQCVEITEGPCKGKVGEIYFVGEFGGSPPTGKVVPENTPCWVFIQNDKKEKFAELTTASLISVTSAEDLRQEFKKKLKILQRKCPHPVIKEQSHRYQSNASDFYERDRPDWEPEYAYAKTYTCKICEVSLKPNTRTSAKNKWSVVKSQ